MSRKRQEYERGRELAEALISQCIPGNGNPDEVRYRLIGVLDQIVDFSDKMNDYRLKLNNDLSEIDLRGAGAVDIFLEDHRKRFGHPLTGS